MAYKKIIFALILILAFSGVAFAGTSAEIINNFALNAGKILAQSEGTYFFSPFSIITALSMAYKGASGQTARELESVLGFSPELHANLGEYVRDIDKSGQTSSPKPKHGLTEYVMESGRGWQISSANRIWLRDGLKLNKDFQSTLYLYYKSEPEELDFKNKTEESREKINEWVSSKTNNKINNLIQNLDPETLMILTNAVYFNARWLKIFDKDMTKPENFYDGNNIVKVPMMKQYTEFDFAEADGVKAVRLPYDGRRMSMLAILPPKDNADFSLDAESLKRCLEKLERYEVDLWLPKFKTEIRYELKELFSALGINNAFSDEADFSGITDDEKLKIDAIIHQTFIEVDEEKTEAAAATAIELVGATAMPIEPKRAEFHADHPFIYFIIDDYTNTILFMGRQTF